MAERVATDSDTHTHDKANSGSDDRVKQNSSSSAGSEGDERLGGSTSDGDNGGLLADHVHSGAPREGGTDVSLSRAAAAALAQHVVYSDPSAAAHLETLWLAATSSHAEVAWHLFDNCALVAGGAAILLAFLLNRVAESGSEEGLRFALHASSARGLSLAHAASDAFSVAVRRRHFAVATLLAPLSLPNSGGCALRESVERSDSAGVQFILELAATGAHAGFLDVDKLDESGCSVLGRAVDRGLVTAARLLLELGKASPSACVPGSGYSPLWIAAHLSGASGTVLVCDLINAGADMHPDPCLDEPCLPISRAANRGNVLSVAALGASELGLPIANSMAISLDDASSNIAGDLDGVDGFDGALTVFTRHLTPGRAPLISDNLSGRISGLAVVVFGNSHQEDNDTSDADALLCLLSGIRRAGIKRLALVGARGSADECLTALLSGDSSVERLSLLHCALWGEADDVWDHGSALVASVVDLLSNAFALRALFLVGQHDEFDAGELAAALPPWLVEFALEHWEVRNVGMLAGIAQRNLNLEGLGLHCLGTAAETYVPSLVSSLAKSNVRRWLTPSCSRRIDRVVNWNARVLSSQWSFEGHSRWPAPVRARIVTLLVLARVATARPIPREVRALRALPFDVLVHIWRVMAVEEFPHEERLLS
eukprot:a841303_17.p1 GENE.a841303_17~~a841303_17.p1  ORF type:complete len:666 (-),score=159.47 a841303_17:56-2026(-)